MRFLDGEIGRGFSTGHLESVGLRLEQLCLPRLGLRICWLVVFLCWVGLPVVLLVSCLCT